MLRRRLAALALVPLLAGAMLLQAQPAKDAPRAKGIKPQRVFSVGHSFHFFMPPIVNDIATGMGIYGHKQVGLSAIGGSRVIQHWNVPDEKNKVKEALTKGEVDVLTLAPIHLPDEGIENFVKLALEHNPSVRVTVQENWLPFDIYDPTFKERPKTVDHNAPTPAELRKLHEPYFKKIDEHVRELNEKYGKQVAYVVPVGQAVIALREKIVEGKAPGLKQQADLFTDPIGHARPPLAALVGWCHFVSIYKHNPAGLRAPAVLRNAKLGDEDLVHLNRLLQDLAWEAAVKHPLSGVR